MTSVTVGAKERLHVAREVDAIRRLCGRPAGQSGSHGCNHYNKEQ
jgi:hypothetical protein